MVKGGEGRGKEGGIEGGKGCSILVSLFFFFFPHTLPRCQILMWWLVQ